MNNNSAVSTISKYYTLITGASSGIGWELAHQYAQNGHPVILTARTTAKLNELKSILENKYKSIIEVISCDLSQPHSAKVLFDEIQKRNLKINGLVNNAGFGDHSEFIHSNLNKNLEMIQLNITTLVELTQLFSKDLILNAPSRILNVASTASFFPGPLMAVYYATKAFVLSFTEAISVELKNKNVFVTALCPGPTTSGFQEVAQFTNNKLTETLKFPSSAEVAEYAYKKAMKNQTVAIHGGLNNIMVFLGRLLPRFMVRELVYKVQAKRQP